MHQIDKMRGACPCTAVCIHSCFSVLAGADIANMGRAMAAFQRIPQAARKHYMRGAAAGAAAAVSLPASILQSIGT